MNLWQQLRGDAPTLEDTIQELRAEIYHLETRAVGGGESDIQKYLDQFPILEKRIKVLELQMQDKVIVRVLPVDVDQDPVPCYVLTGKPGDILSTSGGLRCIPKDCLESKMYCGMGWGEATIPHDLAISLAIPMECYVL